jgi:hypothetical protein
MIYDSAVPGMDDPPMEGQGRPFSQLAQVSQNAQARRLCHLASKKYWAVGMVWYIILRRGFLRDTNRLELF